MNLLKNYLQGILLILILILLVGIYVLIGYYYFYERPKEEVTIIENVEASSSEEIIPSKMYVDLKGAVQNPGVYEIFKDTIINDVIILAGGFNSNAYTNNINLSKKINDETVIYVYTKYEYSLIEKENEEEPCVCPEVDISNCLNSGSSVIENNPDINLDLNEEKQENNSFLININTADQTLLMTLNGIGEAKAKNIIEYRNQNGNFLTIQDITKVSGISENIYEKIKEYITV